MIVLAAALMIAAPAAAPEPPGAERSALSACLQKFSHDKLNDKLSADAFKKGAQAACAAQEATFRAAWVRFDVAMRTKPSEAEQNAAEQVEDYLQNSTDDYVSTTNPTDSKSPKGDPTVKPASSTTPPKP